MRVTLLIILGLCFSVVSSVAQNLPAALNERLVAIALAPSANSEDQKHLESYLKAGDVEEAIATAALFKHWPAEYREAFVAFYHIDRSAKESVLSNEEINVRVNDLLKKFKGRQPLETATRIYISFRRTGFVAERSDRSTMSLERMFRASIFTGITDGSKNGEVHRLAAIADGKEPSVP